MVTVDSEVVILFRGLSLDELHSVKTEKQKQTKC